MNKSFRMESSLYWAMFNPPFRYESCGQQIWDAKDRLVADIRSWGYLTGKGALGLPEEAAAEMQDRFGGWVAKALTDCAKAEQHGDNMPHA